MARKLTAAQEKRLHAALTVDDLLYQKFEWMRQQFDRDVKRRTERHIEVLRVRDKNVLEQMQLQRVEEAPGLLRIIVS